MQTFKQYFRLILIFYLLPEIAELITVFEIEATPTSLVTDPQDALSFAYSTVLNTIYIKKILPPEIKEESYSSFHSDSFDYEGKQSIHTETILQQTFEQSIVQLLWWFDQSTQKSLFLVATKQCLYLYEYIDQQLKLINQIKQQTIINTVYNYYQQHKTIIAIGLDDGNIHFAYIKPNKDKITFSILKEQIEDAADYITQIITNGDTLYASSGDGFLYSYDIDKNLELQDISEQHKYELSCLIPSGNKMIVGTDDKKLLIYKHTDFSQEVGKVKLEHNCNCMESIQNLLIAGLEDGSLRGYNINTLQYIGVLAKVMEESIDLIKINSDNSLIFTSTREVCYSCKMNLLKKSMVYLKNNKMNKHILIIYNQLKKKRKVKMKNQINTLKVQVIHLQNKFNKSNKSQKDMLKILNWHKRKNFSKICEFFAQNSRNFL